MTRRRLLRSHVRRVAIAASFRLLILIEFLFYRDYLGVRRLLVVFVASGAGSNGHVRRQSAHGRGARNVDVTRGAFHYVLALTTFVAELCRNALRRQQRHKYARRFVTAGAVVVDGLLIFPVTSKTCVVTARHCLEELAGLIGGVRDGRALVAHQFIVALMTDGAVVVVRFLFIRRERNAKQSGFQPQSGNHVLMPVVRKLNRELTLVLWLGRLIGIVGFAKGETRSFARRRAHVTDRAGCRTGSAHRLSRKKLWPMTTYAGFVIGKISDVWKIALRVPVGRNLMTGIAGKRFVLLG